MRAILAVFGLLTGFFLVGAADDPPVNCPEGTVPSGTQCVIDVTDPSVDPGEDPGGGGGGGGGPVVCRYGEKEVPCSGDGWVWIASHQCYGQPMDPQPPKDDPVLGELWEGNDDGVVYSCWPPGCRGPAEGIYVSMCYESRYWFGETPTPGPSAQELAERAVETMGLSMGEIGSTPPSREARPGSVGLIGVPIWLWVADPGESTTGPISRTASAGGLSVTATGTLERVAWTLRDGDTGAVYASTSCAGDDAPGTAWSGQSGSSPRCGFTGGSSDRVGRQTLTGTAYWAVTWTSNQGQSGTVDVAVQSRDAQLDLGEVQVITQ